MDIYNADFRKNDSMYLIRQSQELLEIAKANKNSNAIIYACLDTRIALEILDLNKILLSVDLPTRIMIIKDCKPKNGIDKVNKKIGSLKEKYQFFFQAVCENLNVDDQYYDLKKSKELQQKLSKYIHSYYMMTKEINYDSEIMQNAFPIIIESHSFIKSSLHFEGKKYVSYGINMETIPNEDKILLEEWKTSSKMDYNELKRRLGENLILRKS